MERLLTKAFCVKNTPAEYFGWARGVETGWPIDMSKKSYFVGFDEQGVGPAVVQ